MICSPGDLDFEGAHHVETHLAEWCADVDTRDRKWGHKLSFGLLKTFLASDALVYDNFRCLKALEDPIFAAELA